MMMFDYFIERCMLGCFEIILFLSIVIGVVFLFFSCFFVILLFFLHRYDFFPLPHQLFQLFYLFLPMRFSSSSSSFSFTSSSSSTSSPSLYCFSSFLSSALTSSSSFSSSYFSSSSSSSTSQII